MWYSVWPSLLSSVELALSEAQESKKTAVATQVKHESFLHAQG